MAEKDRPELGRNQVDKFKDIPEYLRIHTNRLCDNLARVDSLIDLYDYVSTLLRRHDEAVRQGHVQPMERLPDALEVLRASVVFLHAALEDVLRSIAAKHISRTNSDVLKDVPFLDSGIRANKFTLAGLLDYRGETIEGLIDKSINQWLEHRSFNDCKDIAALLEQIGIDATSCNSEFATLDEMIKRRHRIVHNADRQDVYDKSKIATLEKIDRDTVGRWRDSVQTFMVQVMFNLQNVVFEHVLKTHRQLHKWSCSASAYEFVSKLHDKVDADKFPLQNLSEANKAGFQFESFLNGIGFTGQEKHEPPTDAFQLLKQETSGGRYPLVSMLQQVSPTEVNSHIMVASQDNNEVVLLDPAAQKRYTKDSRETLLALEETAKIRPKIHMLIYS